MAIIKDELNIVFLDNRENLTLNQIEYFHRNLMGMQTGTDKEKKIINEIYISELETRKFSVQIENKIKINFIGETIETDIGIEGNLDDKTMLRIEQLGNCSMQYPTLYVVDLCLDSSDQEPHSGEMVGNILREKYKENADVLFMSGNINFWYGKNASEECWFVYRACREDIMNESFQASAASPYTHVLLDDYNESDPMFKLIKYLLCSKYYNRQYLGVVLLKVCILSKRK